MAQVKALKSFQLQGQIKHPWSAPFEIADNAVAQFCALHLVELHQTPATANPGPGPAPGTEPGQEPVPSRRARKPNASTNPNSNPNSNSNLK